MYLIFKYVLAWITYVNSLDSRLGESTWRWTYDYQVLRDRDYSDLDDKDFFVLPDIATEIAGIEKKGLGKEDEVEEKNKLFQDLGAFECFTFCRFSAQILIDFR